MKIEEIMISDEKYPKQLKNIYDPPKKIYVLGNKEILNQKSIAIVGTRKATQYGKDVAYRIANELGEYGINVISGLAKGIDTYAHIGALKSKGKTIAVLGCGLDQIYPKENRKLAIDILNEGGCIVSEYLSRK